MVLNSQLIRTRVLHLASNLKFVRTLAEGSVPVNVCSATTQSHSYMTPQLTWDRRRDIQTSCGRPSRTVPSTGHRVSAEMVLQITIMAAEGYTIIFKARTCDFTLTR